MLELLADAGREAGQDRGRRPAADRTGAARRQCRPRPIRRARHASRPDVPPRRLGAGSAGQQQHAGGRRSPRRGDGRRCNRIACWKTAKWPTSAPTASGSAAAARIAASSGIGCSTWAPAASASARTAWRRPTSPNRAASWSTTTTSIDGGHVYAGGQSASGSPRAATIESRTTTSTTSSTPASASAGTGMTPQTARTTTSIELNHVHHLGHGVLSDAGLIYCLGVSPGSVIRNNVFHDIWPYSKPAARLGNLPRRHVRQLPGREQPGLQHAQRRPDVQQRRPRARHPEQHLRPVGQLRPLALLREAAQHVPAEHRLPDAGRIADPLRRAVAQRAAGRQGIRWATGTRTSTGTRAAPTSFGSIAAASPSGRRSGSIAIRGSPIRGLSTSSAHDFRLAENSPARELGFQPFDISRSACTATRRGPTKFRHADCPAAACLRPRLRPNRCSLNDDFEKTPVGQHPAHAQVSGEEQGASILVSDERAARGKHSLKVTDSKTLEPTWQPHFYYEPHFTGGVVRQSFDVWLDPRRPVLHRVARHRGVSPERRPERAVRRQWGRQRRRQEAGRLSAGNLAPRRDPSHARAHQPKTFTLILTPATASTRRLPTSPSPARSSTNCTGSASAARLLRMQRTMWTTSGFRQSSRRDRFEISGVPGFAS